MYKYRDFDDEQIYLYMEKYPCLGEGDILFALELCQRKHLDLDLFLDTVVKEISEV